MSNTREGITGIRNEVLQDWAVLVTKWGYTREHLTAYRDRRSLFTAPREGKIVMRTTERSNTAVVKLNRVERAVDISGHMLYALRHLQVAIMLHTQT